MARRPKIDLMMMILFPGLSVLSNLSPSPCMGVIDDAVAARQRGGEEEEGDWPSVHSPAA